MLSSRLIIYRSRTWKVPSGQNFRGIAANWLYDVDDDDRKDRATTASRRLLTTGRRHGWKGDKEKNEKKNFSKEFLEPAARGVLKYKHRSGIPKTAVRKHKGHEVHGIEEPRRDVEKAALEQLEYIPPDFYGSSAEGDDLVQTLTRDVEAATAAKTQISTSGGGSRGSGGNGDGRSVTVNNFVHQSQHKVSFLNIERHPLKDPEYWREEDYDIQLSEEDEAFVARLANMETSGSGDASAGEVSGDLDFSDFDFDFDFDSIEWDAEDDSNDDVDGDDLRVEEEREEHGRKGKRAEQNEDLDIDDQGHYLRPSDRPTWYETVSTLQETGEDGADFWAALAKHPTHYAERRLFNSHPESKRIPQPYYPPTRAYPSRDFVETFVRFMFVSGLPPTLSDGAIVFGKSALSTLQQQDVQKTVTRLLGISADQVFPASGTSAFVGFHSSQERDSTLRRGLKEKILFRSITISQYSPSNDENNSDFVKEAAPGTIVKLENVPPERFSRATLARDLFPADSELSAAYRISAADVIFPSPTTALIRFASKEQAESALTSEYVASRLDELGKYPVQLFKARRDIVYDRMGGPAKTDEIWKMGQKIIVDGDMPSKHFYLYHAGTILLRGLDRDSISKESIAEFFQPFSKTLRDVKGSVEFVTCEGGLPTDRAYVGFDYLGEAEAVMHAFSGRTMIGDNIVKMKLIKDRWRPNVPKRQERPERTEEEILENLNNWEQYVDPADIKYLEENGVPKQVIDESLRGIRYYNRSFGSLDWAMSDEKLEPEKESGEDFRELVQMYVEGLKECIATPENPGEPFKGLHFPGEPLDLTIFDKEKKRQEALLKKRQGL